MPYSPIYLALFILALGLLMGLVQLGLVTATFEKLGLSPHSALLLLFVSLFGSAINLPLFSVSAEAPSEAAAIRLPGLLRLPQLPFSGRTLIVVNVGGCLVPLCLALYIYLHSPVTWAQVVMGTAIVAGVSYFLSRPIAGIGIAMPILVAPATAALAGLTLGGDAGPALAYIAGSLGVLLGADLLRLPDVRRLGVPIASIGGAGTFDGIFITGLVAVLLS